MKHQIAIQGVAGAFHEIAAKHYFQNDEVEIIPCNTFKEIFDTIEHDKTKIGIIAIENTIAGSLLQNHQLLSNSNVKIIGEHKLRITHNLVALPGQQLNDITEIHSHPIALMQCEEYLNQHKNIKVVESEDTALSAKEIAEKHILGQAAICSELAAQMYGLTILQQGIETNRHNFTRFLIIADATHPLTSTATTPNKASLMFTVTHEEGSLTKILTIFTFFHLNLSKIQSLPIIGREWEYRFYVNLEWKNYEQYKNALTAVKPLTNEFKILGEYTAC